MKIIVSLIFILHSLWGFSQSREELIQQIVTYYNAGEYDKALPFARKAVEAARKEVGEAHHEYAVAMSDLSMILKMLGEYEESLSWFKKVSELRKTLLGEAHPDYLNSVFELASINKILGNYGEAERNFILIAETWKYLEGSYPVNYVKVISELAFLYLTTGDLGKAENHLLDAERIKKQLYGVDHPEYSSIASGLGILYMQLGRYDRSEPFLLKALQIQEGTGNQEEISTSLNNLGLLYFTIPQYEKAEEYFIRSQEIRKSLGDTLGNEYATLSGNLGALYTQLEKYDKALQHFITATNIRRELFGPEHPEYALAVHNLASVYIYLNQLKKAEDLMKDVIRIYKKTWGEEHHEYSNSLGNLAALYFEQKRYTDAEPLLLDVLKIRRKAFGDIHPDYASSLRNLAILYIGMKKYEKAEQYIIAQNKAITDFLTTTFDYLPEKEREEYLESQVLTLDDNNSFLVNHKKASAAAVNSNFEQLLFLKSLSLSGSQNLLAALRSAGDENTRQQFSRWLDKKKQMAQLLTVPEDERETDLKKLEKEARDLEKQLMQSSSAFRDQQSSLHTRIDDVRKKMKDDEALIEFVRFDYYLNDWTDTVFYAAYILSKRDSIPVFIPLFEEKQLQALFDSAGTNPADQANSFYRGLGKKNRNAGLVGEKLYRLIWQPLEKHLEGKKRISYSPSGLIYNIALHALPVDSNSLLLDLYEFSQYSSTRLLVNRDMKRTNPDSLSITLFGDPVFDKEIPSPGISNKDSLTLTSLGRRGGRDKWDALPGTATEVSGISQIFLQKGRQARSFIGAGASEREFKNLDGQSPKILHVATHGFFLSAPEKRKTESVLSVDNSYSRAEHPLMRSGLVFAGANHAWSGKPVEQGVEDGIATAYEISQLDLSNTELVVLSACETALGDVKGSEGVFGLQRAFKMAGVKKMIVSLWQVPDKETAELMTAFYSYYLTGISIEESFSKAQSEMRKKYSPFYWAAFVLVE